MRNAKKITGVSMYTNCPHINLGALTFQNMEHYFYFSVNGSFEQFCLPDMSTSDIPNPALFIRSTLPASTALALGNFLTLQNEGQLRIIYDRDYPDYVARLDSVQVSILGTSFVTSIAVQNNTLGFSKTVNLFSIYPTILEVSAPTNEASWDHVPLSIKGEMTSGPASFSDDLENAIHTELQRRADIAVSRQSSAEMSRQRPLEQIAILENQINESKRAIESANQTYADALTLLADALAELDDAQPLYDNSTAEISQLQTNLDSLCMEMECEDVCMRGCTPGVCYVENLVNVIGQCPYIEYVMRERRVAPFYEERKVWRWVTVCRDPSGGTYECSEGECRPRSEGDYCYGICKSVYERTPLLNYERKTVAVQRSRDCTVATYTETQPVTCCEPDMCAVQAPNKTCLDANVICQTARRTALDQLEQAEQDSVAIILQLDQARTSVSTARSAVSGAEVQLDLANQRLRQIEPAYENAKLSREAAESSYSMTINEISADLQLNQLLSRYPLMEIITVSSVDFNITILSNSPTVIPLMISYETPYKNISYNLQVDFNFAQGSRELAFKVLSKTMIDQAFPDLAPVRRSVKSNYRVTRQAVDPEEINMNQLRFDENCGALNSMRDFLREIADSLLRVNASIQIARDDIESQTEAATENISDESGLVNFTVLEMEFNVTTSIESLMETAQENEQLIAYNTLIGDYHNLTAELLMETETTTFMDWLTQVETIYGENTTIGGYPCLNFGDCLVLVTNVLEDVLVDTPGSTAVLLLEELPSARNELLKLATATNLTISQAIESVSSMLTLVEQSAQIDYWCNSLPVVTVQPPPEVFVPNNGTLSITCEARSNLSFFYQWKRNGNSIPGATRPNLILHNMQRPDSANYSCEVSNDIGAVSSINSSVLVYELPEFYLTPVSLSVYEGADAGALFTCNSSSWPYPGWRWFFRPSADDQWTLIEEEDTNELYIPKPQKESEGWYACETFNGHGTLRSDPVYLRILPVTVSQQLIPVEFQLLAEGNATCTVQDLSTAIEHEMQQLIDSTTIYIQDLAIDEDVAASEYIVTFSVVTNNVTEKGMNEKSFVEIANQALPTREGLERTTMAIENSVEGGNFTLECGGGQYSALPSSLSLLQLTYVCPEGQQLNTDYLLCGMLLVYVLQLISFYSSICWVEDTHLCQCCLVDSGTNVPIKLH